MISSFALDKTIHDLIRAPNIDAATVALDETAMLNDRRLVQVCRSSFLFIVLREGKIDDGIFWKNDR